MRQLSRSQHGFTMVEVLIVVVIIAILAAFAAPSMRDLLRTQGVRAASYDLMSDLTFARSQAITLGHNVQFASAAGDTNWVSGYTITDTSVTPNRSLRTQSAANPTVAFTANAPALVFDRAGRISGGTVSFNIVPADPAAPTNEMRCVSIDPSGRPRSTTGACS